MVITGNQYKRLPNKKVRTEKPRIPNNLTHLTRSLHIPYTSQSLENQRPYTSYTFF